MMKLKPELMIAKAAVKAAAEEMGISYKNALRTLYEDYCGESLSPDNNSPASLSSQSHGPSTMAREILKGILNNPQYHRVPQYVFSIKQLNREDRAFVIANMGGVGYAIESAIIAELDT